VALAPVSATVAVVEQISRFEPASTVISGSIVIIIASTASTQGDADVPVSVKVT